MIIYRIEHINHPTDGAWGLCGAASRAIVQAYRESTFIASWHPGPDHDKGIARYPNLDEFCAFPSLDAYRSWFVTPTVRAALYDGPAHMVVYTVTHVTARSMLQCLFRMEDVIAKRVATPEEYQ